MPSLKEILDSHEEVIVDRSIKPGSSFLQNTFEISDYSCLDTNLLRSETLNFQKFIDYLNHPNSRTIPEITQEIKTYAEKVGDKISFLSFKDTQRNRKERSKKSTRFSKKRSLNQELLKEFQKRIFDVYRISKNREIRITNPDYNSLAEIIIQLEKVLHLKQDTGYLLGWHDEDRAHDSKTDEKITATVFWQSMFSDKSPVLATQDKDFISLLGVLPKIIGSDEFSPYNQLFRRQVTGNPFILYYTDGSRGDEYKRHLNNAYIDFNPKFRLGGVSLKVNKEMKKRIREFWKQFSEIHDLKP